MKQSLRKAALCAAASIVFAGSAPAAIRFDPAKFMRVNEVRPGMIAEGRSVFKGTKIESFRMEILAVLPKAFRGRDAVLARILDGPVVQRQSGVIGGMSGSPVFVNGRLLGAIAFGWSFSKEPIAGITPIENMLAVQGDQPEQPGGKSAHQLPKPMTVGGKKIQRVVIESGPAEKPSDSRTMRLTPMGGIVLASGLEGRARQKLAELLEPYGLVVLQGPGGSVNFGTAADLQPGAAVGVGLMSGDFQAYGVGTLTWREKDDVLAFGHGMMEMGKVDFPMHAAVVHEIVPSLEFSSKLASAGAVVGRLTQDRMWGIAGEAKKPPRTIPIRCSVAQAGRKERNFRVQIVDHPRLTAGMAGILALAAVDDTWGYADKGTAQVSVEIHCKGRPVIARRDVVFSARDVAVSVLGEVAAPLDAFLQNDFGALEIEQVNLRVELQAAQRTARLERLTTRTQKVKAGDEVLLDAVLRPYRGEPITRTIALKVPRDTPGGPMRIVASGGQEAEMARQMLGGARFVPTSVDDLLRYYQERKRADALVVQAALPSRGLDVLGKELPSLPQAVADVMQAGRSSDIRLQPDRVEQLVNTDWVISGRQAIMVTVEGRPGIAAPRMPVPQPPPAPPKAEQESAQPNPGDEGSDEEEALPASQWSLPGYVDSEDAAAVPEAGRKAPTAPSEASKQPQPKALAAKPGEWVHSRREDYEQGKFAGISVDSAGRLALSWASTQAAEVPQAIPFSVLQSGDSIYVGTGHKGIIYRIGKDGKASEFFRTGQVIVHCLARDAAGSVYAGTSPDGTVWRISPDGKGEKFYASGQKYVWCLAVDKQGTIYAGMGNPARIDTISPDGKGQTLAKIAASHVFSVVPDGAGGAWAGTGEGGVVYRVTAAGDAIPVLDTPAEAILSLAADADGGIWAGCSPRGLIYRIDPDGKSKVVLDTQQQHVFSLLRTDRGILAATANRGLVFLLSPDQRGPAGYASQVLLKREQGDVVNLAASDGGVIAACSNPGVVTALEQKFALKGTFESPVLDAARRARWGRMAWVAQLPEGTTVQLQTRSGETADPDDQWSQWSTPCVQGGGIASAPARYLQYRVTMETKDGGRTPTLLQMMATYAAENRPPVVTIEQPKPGSSVAKSVEIKWKMDDPDKDTIRCDLFYSNDSGQTWKPVKENASETSYKWDAAKLPDGQYLLRAVASDRITRAAEAQSAEATAAVLIDNTAPQVMVLRHSVKVEEGKFSARGVAGDKDGFVSGVDWRVDSGEWQAASLNAVDGHQVDFSFTAEKVAPGKHQVEVRAFDEAGNISTDKTPVTVPAPKPKEEPKQKEEPKPAAEPKPAPAEPTARKQ